MARGRPCTPARWWPDSCSAPNASTISPTITPLSNCTPTDYINDSFIVAQNERMVAINVVSHYLSGAQTRRIGPLVDHYPEPRVEMHPTLAGRAGDSPASWPAPAIR